MSVFKTDLLLDGAMGTMLMERARLRPGVRTESLNVTAPEIVAGVHRDYIEAGSGMILANTFGAGTAELIEAGVKIALAAAGDRAAVAADIGPTGRVVSPSDFDGLLEYFRKLTDAAARCGVKAAVIETMGSLTELRAALIAAKESGLDTAALMTFERNGRTYFGTDVASFAVVAQGLGADAVGANCSLGAEDLLFTARRLLDCTDLPVIIKPNAGLPRIVDGKPVYSETPGHFAAGIAALKQAGVDIVGGVEAIISHYLTEKLMCPCVHAPAFEDVSITGRLVDPKVSAEYITPTFLPCLMFGLKNAPLLIDTKNCDMCYKPDDSGHYITCRDLHSVVVPHDALGSSVVLDSIEQGIKVFAVKENNTVLNVNKYAIGKQNDIIEVDSYEDYIEYLEE